ncbi:MAG TPA: PQQ-binding-like beta-propeller repeat protein [Pyrinomonadaceae bacterium]|nr:PQQ-binding-like beta-propeller repeat protein [Pyrinomonadaceae bacterium]
MNLRFDDDLEIICAAHLLAKWNHMTFKTIDFTRKPMSLVGVVVLFAVIIPPAIHFPAAHSQTLHGKLSLSNPLVSRWEYGTDQTLNLTPAVREGAVYLPLAAGNLIALRLSDGKLDWRAEMGGDITASPASDERAVYVASQTVTPLEYAARTEGTLRALSRNSGVTLWSRTLPSPLKGFIAVDETGLFGSGGDGQFYAFEKETGKTRWVLSLSAPLTTSLTSTAGSIYVGSRDGFVVSIEKNSGTNRWRYQTPGLLVTSLAVGNNRVYVGTAEGFVLALDESTGNLIWRARNGSGIQSLAVTAQGIIAASSDNFVYLLSTRRGRRIWKRQLSGRVTAAPAVLSQQAFFCPLAGEECVVVDLKSGRKVNRLVVGEDNNTSASPQVAGNLLLVTTRRGLLAFSNPDS